ncbi:hypothetical protein QTP86_029816 [Hemibagrus guttatus]|nr:hypothetical protein QTP86_029816 [Hemibagrus guttatus]
MIADMFMFPGLTAAAMAEAMKLQKMNLMAMNSIHGASSQNGTESENEELNSNAGKYYAVADDSLAGVRVNSHENATLADGEAQKKYDKQSASVQSSACTRYNLLFCSRTIAIREDGGSESSWDKEKLQSPPSSGAQHGLAHASLSGSHLTSLQQSPLLANRLDLPFMMMPHPLLPVSLPPASVAMAMNQMNHLNTIANMAAAAQMHSPLSRAGASVIKECVQESPSPAPSLEETPRPGSQPSSHASSSVSSSPHPHSQSPEHLVLNPADGELADRETGINMKKIIKEKGKKAYGSLHLTVAELGGDGENMPPGTELAGVFCLFYAYQSLFLKTCGNEAQIALPLLKSGFEKLPLGAQTLPPGFPAPFLFTEGLSSVETLLTNIQGLLKVAVDNARVQEKQVQQERKELKLELYREREMRESLERQLTTELHSRATIQKRLKKEKKVKRKLQEALDFESKRREQVEQALKQATSPESLCMSLNEAVIPEVEPEHNGNQQDSAMQENRPYSKPPIMY